MSHTMKIWEKIIDGQIRDETSIGAEQFGFMLGEKHNGCSFFPESHHGEIQRRTERITYGVHRPREGI